MIHKTVIIGSGPAGYTAAIYAARANLAPVIFTGDQPGGQLMTTNEVENFPGYPNGTTGPEMMEDLEKQAKRFGAEVIHESIAKVDFATGKNHHDVWTGTGKCYHATTIIIATGASANYLGLDSEEKLMNKGVSACAVCDGFFYRGKRVGVVGGGDTACEEAIYLANLCPEVHLFVRRDVLRASKIMQDRITSVENIEIHWNTEVHEVLGEEEVDGVKLYSKSNKSYRELPLEGLFIAIGHTPNTEIFSSHLSLDDQGYISLVDGSTNAGVTGVFACGDVADKTYRQAITAAGTGCQAALDAERFLAEQ